MYRFALALALIVAAARPVTESPTKEPTPTPVFQCPPEDVCPPADCSTKPEKPVCCPSSPGRRSRRLNFYPSTGCCGMPGVDDYCD